MTPTEIRALATSLRHAGRFLQREGEELGAEIFLHIANRCKRRAQHLHRAGPDAFYIQIDPATPIYKVKELATRHEFLLYDIIYDRTTGLCTATLAPM